MKNIEKYTAMSLAVIFQKLSLVNAASATTNTYPPRGINLKYPFKGMGERMSEREFWIFKGTSCFADELKPSDDLDALVKHRSADGFYDLVSENDTIEGGIHVIEYSAYEQMKQERDELKAKLDRLNKIIHLAQSQCGLPDPIEACRTVLNTLRSNCNVQCGSTASESQLEDAVSEIIRVWEWTFLPENEYTQMVGDIRDVFDCLLKRLKRHPNESQHHCGTEGTK